MVESLILIYGRPFDAADERALGNGPVAALEALAAEHPDLVHAPAEPGGGAWWIGREAPPPSEKYWRETPDNALVLPLNLDEAWSRRMSLGNTCPMQAEVRSFCAALPDVLRLHPLLRREDLYLIREAR